MLSRVFHAWERQAGVGRNRPNRAAVRLGAGVGETALAVRINAGRASRGVGRPDGCGKRRVFRAAAVERVHADGDWLTFPSAVETPYAENNLVRARYFPDASPRGSKRAVVVLPQWNADSDGHVGLCHLLNRFKISALRLTLPYHDARKPPELRRADYIVSSNVGRTAQACRQAVLDARRAVAWLASRGYESIGILGTSLGSCLAMLTAAHEPLLRAVALNHISPYFADVVWSGLSTEHVRLGLDGHVDLDRLRRIWMPISPYPYLNRMRGKRLLLVYARYDLTFPVDLSRMLVSEFRRRGIEHQLAVLPCGHYSTGVTPFKWLDGLTLCRFLSRNL